MPTANRTVKKTTTPAKRAVKKPGSASKKVEPPKLHAKNTTLLVSIGDKDRKNTIEQMTEALKKVVEKMGYNVTIASSYYVLDGKVCAPQDYDPETQQMKPGATVPQWAGGPAVNTLLERVGQEEFKVEKPAYTPRENMDAIRPILEKNAARKRTQAAPDEDAELEEFDWEVGDEGDDEKMEKVAKKSQKAAIARLKSTEPKKRVVRKKNPATVTLPKDGFMDQSKKASKKRVVKKSAIKKPIIKKTAVKSASRTRRTK